MLFQAETRAGSGISPLSARPRTFELRWTINTGVMEVPEAVGDGGFEGLVEFRSVLDVRMEDSFLPKVGLH